MSQLRVLHLITAAETGGAETFLCRLLSRLPRERFKSRVVCMVRPGHVGGRIRALGIPLATLGMRRGLPSVGAVRKLMEMLQDFQPDVVQTWLHHADLLGLVAARLAVESNLVWNLRNSRLDAAPWTTRAVVWLCARLSRLPEAVLTNSETARDQHRALGFRPRRFEVLPNGIDCGEFRPDPAAREALRKEFGISPETPLAGMLARHAPMKNHAGFLRAAALVLKELPEARFLLCGTGVTQVNRELMAQVNQAGLRGRVILAGYRQDAPRVLNALDALCVPSAYGEGFPNAAAEAMSCGVPCAATDTGDAARVVGDTGRVVPPNDEPALSRALVELLTLPPDQRTALAGRCRQRIATEFSLDAAARAYASFYEELAGRR